MVGKAFPDPELVLKAFGKNCRRYVNHNFALLYPIVIRYDGKFTATISRLVTL